jgi:hypothetical protein
VPVVVLVDSSPNLYAEIGSYRRGLDIRRRIEEAKMATCAHLIQ